MHHWGRDLVVSPDGNRIFYSVGSGSNVALDMFPVSLDAPFEDWKNSHSLDAAWDTEERRADVLSYEPDGSNERIVATGLRNCQGWRYATGKVVRLLFKDDQPTGEYDFTTGFVVSDKGSGVGPSASRSRATAR